jgi:trehalose 6-phosphate phosphatase
VVSGRPAQFLLDQIGTPGIALWGLHGLERAEGGTVVPDPAAAPWMAVVEEVAAAAERDFEGAVGVERKGVALTLHYRVAPGGAAALAAAGGPGGLKAWCDAVAGSTKLVVHPARMSYELRPPVPHGKGLTLERAVTAAGLRAACFAGDDASDVDGFDALRRLAEDAGVRTVAVGVRSGEAPPELLERADILVDGPHGALALLEDLARALDTQS